MGTKLLMTYSRVVPERKYGCLVTHRIELTSKTMWESQRDFGSDGGMPGAKVAFLFSNSRSVRDGRKKRKVVPGVGGNREILLVDDTVYLRVSRKEAGLSYAARGFSLVEDGKLVLFLQFLGRSEGLTCGARELLRAHVLGQ